MKTSESVTPSHPDKMCDRISDALLDLCLSKDPMARFAVETVGGHGRILIIGEVTTKATINWEVEAEKIVKLITGKHNMNVEVKIVQQSGEIANGVDTGGAGDQGIMTGYACNDNEAMIPHEHYLARELAKFIYEKYPYDGKTQITIDENKVITKIVASFQNVSKEELFATVKEWLGNDAPISEEDVLCNPAGDWFQGGFDADTGLTGRKLMVDNYGPQIAIGGGCFSGKDATKVDRSAAYMARHSAVQLLKAYKAIDVTVKLAYAIGVAQPVMATAKIHFYEDENSNAIVTKDVNLLANHYENQEHFTPRNIIEFLDLRTPQYAKTAEWGHFGNNFTWDR